MKGKFISATEKKWGPNKEKTLYEVFMQLDDDKKRKYTCFSNRVMNFKPGDEVEYTEEHKGTWEDQEGITHDKWTMMLPKDNAAMGKGGFRGKSDLEIWGTTLNTCIMKASDFAVTLKFKDNAEAQKWLLDTVTLLVSQARREFHVEKEAS